MTDPSSPREPDFTFLDSRDEYALYYNQLGASLVRLGAWYRRAARQGNREAAAVQGCMDRLLYTVRALRVKYACRRGDPLRVDLTDSGFPSAIEIQSVAADLRRRDASLGELPPAALLKRRILDVMLRERREPAELLWQLAERAYLEMLDERQLLLPFQPGTLELEAGPAEARTYSCTWACYDHATSRPYVHVMTFDQDVSSEPLAERGAGRERFLEVLRGEASRTPGAGPLAAEIDERLEDVHPRILKRIGLGPWFSPLMVRSGEHTADPFCRALTALLVRVARRPDDALFFFDEEIVFAERGPGAEPHLPDRLREIFHLRDREPRVEGDGPLVHRSVLLPHRLLQHIEDAGRDSIPGFAACHKIAYTDKGEFHEPRPG